MANSNEQLPVAFVTGTGRLHNPSPRFSRAKPPVRRQFTDAVTDRFGPRVGQAAQYLYDKGVDYVSENAEDLPGKIIRATKTATKGMRNQDAKRKRTAQSTKRKRREEESSSFQNNSRGSGYLRQTGGGSIVWNSGISAGLTINRRLANKGRSPVFLASGWLFINTDATNSTNTDYVRKELENIYYTLYETYISNSINRYAGLYISKQDFLDWVTAMSKATQLYHSIANILAYNSNTSIENTNWGMEVLRNKLTPNALMEFQLLGDKLTTMCIPPHLHTFIRFMMQNFRISEAPYSSIIRINPGDIFSETWPSGPEAQIEKELFDVRELLGTENIVKFNSYIYRTYPEWVIGDLPIPQAVAEYDKNFATFWHNMNCSYGLPNIGGFAYTRQLENIDSYSDYQILENDYEVDGSIFAASSNFIQTDQGKTASSYWGIWYPYAINNMPTDNIQLIKETYNIKYCATSSEFRALDDDQLRNSCGIKNQVYYTSTSAPIPFLEEYQLPGWIQLQVSSIRLQNQPFNEAMKLWFTPART